MSTATETLPLTDDGWTAENLDYFPDFAGVDEVGGDVQIGGAPSTRHRFVSPDGEVMTVTTHAYATARATEEAIRDGHAASQVDLDFDEYVDLTDLMKFTRARYVEYGYSVVAYIDYWEADNQDADHPNVEDVDYLSELDSARVYGTLAEAEDAAREFIKSTTVTTARDWAPSQYLA